MLTRKNPISNEITPDNGENRDFRFRREERLKGNREIREVFSKGKRFSCHGAKLFLLENNLPFNRICFTFSKLSKGKQVSMRNQFWNAVARNRAKRLGREAFRLIRHSLKCGYNIVLLVYPETEKTAVFSDRERQLESLFKKAGLLK